MQANVPSLAVALFALLGSSFSNATQLPHSEQPFSMGVEVDLVLVPVSVTDSAYRPLAGIGRDQFHVYENGEPTRIVSFSEEDAPASIVIVFDSSASMKSKLKYARQAAISFLQLANPRDEIAIITFAAQTDLRSRLSPIDDDVTLNDDLPSVAVGSTALIDALDLALDQLREARYERRAIVVFSDGGDNHSRHSFGEVKSKALESDAQIYAIAAPTGGREESDAAFVLGRLTNLTGGRYVALRDERKMSESAQTISRMIRSQYLLAFHPNPNLPFEKRVKIQVKVDFRSGGRVHINGRTGYYPQSALTANPVSDIHRKRGRKN
jgi:Ca-activated chloride channel family protein